MVYHVKSDEVSYGKPEPLSIPWDGVPTRRQAACLLALAELWKVSRRLYLWTVTFPQAVMDEVAASTMQRFWSHWMRKLGPCSCVRVAELHVEHGVHFHIVCNRRYPAWEVWRLAERSGIGRVNVVAVRSFADACYVAKYLGKEQRKIYGTNRYSRGGLSFGRVNDCTMEGRGPDLWRECWAEAKRLNGGRELAEALFWQRELSR